MIIEFVITLSLIALYLVFFNIYRNVLKPIKIKENQIK